MKCIDCKFISDPVVLTEGDYPSVRCSLGCFDEGKKKGWYSYGSLVRNRGPIRRYGETCTRGEPNKKGES